MSNTTFELAEPTAVPQMTGLLVGFMATQAIHVAARLGLADLVQEAPKTADELALATGAHGPSLRRLLQFLASLGVFVEDTAGGFRQTPLSATLRSDVAGSVRNLAIMFGSPFIWKAWGNLFDGVETGKPAFERTHGATFFDYLEAHVEDGAIFNAAMSATTSINLTSLIKSYDFSQFEKIVDVGGGHGALLQGILSANPTVRGVLADRPAVIAGAVTVRNEEIADRCEICATNFFEAVPQGADAYVMKFIIHDWSDEESLKILKNCRRAIHPQGKLLLIEVVLRSPNEADRGRFMDLAMLTYLTGRERTEADFKTLLGRAGFSLTQVIPTGGLISIIEGKPV
jgi:hypothetical protein